MIIRARYSRVLWRALFGAVAFVLVLGACGSETATRDGGPDDGSYVRTPSGDIRCSGPPGNVECEPVG